MKWLFVAFVAALIVSVTWWKIGNRASDSASPVTADQGEVGTAEPLPDRRIAAPVALPPSASLDGLSGMNRQRHQQAQAKQAKVVDAGHNKLVARYQNEKVDGGWATAREQSLVAHAVSPQIHDLGVEPKNLTAHCRSSTCQLTADFPTRAAADDWFTLYLTNSGTDLFNAAYQATPNDDGTTHVEIYGLAKQP
jgi:hypothetical protein